jgi:hypothetical protein
MSMTDARFAIPLSVLGCLVVPPASASSVFFSTGDPDGLIATASRPNSAGKIEIETADDFALPQSTAINSATFTGLLPSGAPLSDIADVRVEIYRVFPNDSDVGRTSGAPVFPTTQVPTRVNSPSDVELDDRSASASAHDLTVSPDVINPTFTAGNSVLNGIPPLPGIFTGGDGSVTGQEVQFNVAFTKPFDLAAGHYFFVPQVQLNSGDFFWLSAPRPIVPPGTAFPPGSTDLQSWIRNEDLAPDWLRVGTDITHQGPFNATFSLTGSTIPESSTWAMMLLGFAGLGFAGSRQTRKSPRLV